MIHFNYTSDNNISKYVTKGESYSMMHANAIIMYLYTCNAIQHQQYGKDSERGRGGEGGGKSWSLCSTNEKDFYDAKYL